MKVTEGMMILFYAGTLAKVGKIHHDRFEFDCVNGAWCGQFHFADQTITYAGPGGDKPDVAVIKSITQPPEDISSYDEIIPWMLANPSSERLEA